MARSDFTLRSFRCGICAEEFQALTGEVPVPEPVCMSCGLKYSAEKRHRLVEERQRRSPPKRE